MLDNPISGRRMRGTMNDTNATMKIRSQDIPSTSPDKPLSKPKITEAELAQYELTHRFYGNGLYFLRHLGDDICETCWINPAGVVVRVMMTATAMLSPHMVPEFTPTKENPSPPYVPKPIPPEKQAGILDLRGKLVRGEVQILNQCVVAVTTKKQ